MRSLSRSLVILSVLWVFSVPVHSHHFIQVKGSDTLLVLARAWADAYETAMQDLDIDIAVSGGGSGIGIAGLLKGVVDIANASRQIRDQEMLDAQELGVNPVEHLIGYDALAVYVHKDNPIASLSLAQLKEIFGREGDITKWSDLDVSVPGCSAGWITAVGRQQTSGSYACFKRTVLGKEGEFRLRMLDLHGSEDIIDLVAKSPCAIGYSGLTYAIEEIRMVCIAGETEDQCVNPSIISANDRSYPLARPMFVYTNGKPKGAVKDYLEWILGDPGQCILRKHGFAPVRDDIECIP